MSSDEPSFDEQRIRELIRLVRTPSLKRWRERIQAANELGQIKADIQTKIDAARALRDVVSGGVTGSTTKRGFVIGQLASASLAALACISMAADFRIWLGLSLPFIIVSGIATFVGFWFVSTIWITPLCWLATFRSETRHKNAVRAAAATALGRFSRRIGLGVLTTVVMERNQAVSPAARDALRQLLGRLKETDYGLISSVDMHELCCLLEWPDEELAQEVLEVLRKAGTGTALPYVMRTAQGKRLRLAEAARSAVPILEARARQEADNRRLLRAAESPDEVETLLRPAVGSEGDQPEMLLRPAGTAQDV